MKKLINTLQDLPWIVQLILVLLWGFYANLLRLFRSIIAKNILGIILSILLLCFGTIFFPIWIFDIVCIIIGKKIWWFV